ncbi:hypothetical protein GCM10011506_23510 [Marivirga lumbricoides]|uniref:Uncharacterized protein n=1 Tax=Marivirga lumbricoides TaxID=1046115 RepID=A0ABQ1MAV2_9BACT|nr:hypothetical protein GCM10011506_23510 [Marivirga lumbricoides]
MRKESPNGQWVDYWIDKFDHFRFDLYDILTPKIWISDKVCFWYKKKHIYDNRGTNLHSVFNIC